MRAFIALLLASLPAFADREAEVEDYVQDDAPPARNPFAFNAQSLTDPTQFGHGLAYRAEWTNLSGGEGDLFFLYMSFFQPLGDRDQFRLAIDLPVGYASTSTVGSQAGLGDVRLQFAWRALEAKNAGDVFQALSAQFDLLTPTGSQSKGLGGGDWIVAPSVTAKLRGGSMHWYLTGRWLRANAIRPGGVRAFNVPGNDFGANTVRPKALDAANLEATAVWEFDPAASPIHWTSIGVQLTRNFSGDQNFVARMELQLGREVGAGMRLDLRIRYWLAGEKTEDLNVSVAFVLDF